MNRDDILQAAVDAGFIGMNAGAEVVLGIHMSTGDTLVSLLERFAQAIEEYARKDEREKCIGLAQQQLSEYPAHSYNEGVMACVDAMKEIGRGL